MNVALLAALALFGQSSTEWQSDLKAALSKAETEDKLVLVFESAAGDELSEKVLQVLTQEGTAKGLSSFILVKKAGTRALIRLCDKDGAPRGNLPAPFTPEIVSAWAKIAHDVWKKHEMLVFRSKGRPDEASTCKLAFSLAARLQNSEARAQLEHVLSSRDSEEANLATLQLACSYEAERAQGQAADMWARLETRTRDTSLRALATVHLALIWKLDRPEQAKARFKAVAESQEAPEILKWFARKQLDQMLTLNDFAPSTG